MTPKMAEVNVTGKVISPSRMAHVVLRTPRYEAMVAFYTAFLGAHVVVRTPVIAFLTYDSEHHRIAIAAVPGCGEKVRGSAGLEHIAFGFGGLAELAAAYVQRRARGMVPVWSTNHGPTTSLYYQDPDGNLLETQVDNFDDPAAATAFMLGPDYAANPWGVDFDPDHLVRRLRAGEPEAQIKRRPVSGPRAIETVPIFNPPPPVVRDSYEPIEGAV
ncbi:Glyoxalase/Bleomycin resistance protein/Dihydroxybiphenyl dioxygenase [Durotheca rogersii]|uniref:Glyoxalase/Bleomycin resistance protein/Dihydroxybiphenyl dioxygenase n=1 Tax=Durotheca rogersii TaxID=419775 RepID=UPI00221F3431|nr:Glyoxalase/Bleomycin resistance protein/Dihydroxybiphenyl dioxygenase [Durotheca rogersii]KAI5859533.1 Glyoxalase/Bleomycin resistance protein/Dihydroxybiphenyl dioxygenase [Durotheca rogersii]